MIYTHDELAKAIDHSLPQATRTDQDLEEGYKLAARYGVASVCIRPYGVTRAVEWLEGSGFVKGPGGSSRYLQRAARVAVGLLVWAFLGVAPATAQKAYFPIMIDAPVEYPVQVAFCAETAQPPTMDGRLDDPCWQGVEPLGHFQLTDGRFAKSRQMGAPGRFAKHQTRAKVLQANEALYIAVECVEPEMDKIRTEAVYHDEERICFDDRLCVFIDPHHDHQNVFEFVVNARGATLERAIARPIPFAMSHVLGPLEWNTEWFARVRRLEDRWTAEVCIAMDRLLGRDVCPGDTIGFNICRDRRPVWRFGPTYQKFQYPQECSAWSYVFNPKSGSMAVGNWYEPLMFGDLVFGAKDCELARLAFYQSTADYNGNGWQKPQLWGDNPLDVTLRNPTKEARRLHLEVTTRDVEQRPLVRTAEVAMGPNEEQAVRMAIPVRRCDDQPFTLTVRDEGDGRQLYRTSYSTRVPPFIEFDLTAVYAPVAPSFGGIRFTPVAVDGALDDLTLRMSLCRSGQTEPLATRAVVSPDTSAGFEEAFPGFNVATLEPGNYDINCELHTGGAESVGRYTQSFTRPSTNRGAELGARDGTYEFGGERGRAVIVSFPDAEDYVFWERSSYTPWWDVSGVGVCYEFVECWGYGNMGCSEPMQDKENRFSRVRIIENTPARVVIHWRYALTDPNYRIFRDEWVDEYYYLYPDAIGVREVNLWANGDLTHEFIQPQYIMPPGVLPAQVLERQPARVFNLAGDSVVDDMDIAGRDKPRTVDCDKWPEGVMRICLKDRNDPWYAWVRRDDLFPRIDRMFPPWQPPIGDVRYNLGAHWPIKRLNVDVYNIVSTHQAYHTWSGFINAKADPDQAPNTWVHLIGITDRDDEFLQDVAESWAYPANVTVEGTGWRGDGYDFHQRAYLIESVGTDRENVCQIGFQSKKATTVFNPVFLFKGTTSEIRAIRLNGAELEADEYRAAPTTAATEVLIWMDKRLPIGACIEIEFANQL